VSDAAVGDARSDTASWPQRWSRVAGLCSTQPISSATPNLPRLTDITEQRTAEGRSTSARSRTSTRAERRLLHRLEDECLAGRIGVAQRDHPASRIGSTGRSAPAGRCSSGCGRARLRLAIITRTEKSCRRRRRRLTPLPLPGRPTRRRRSPSPTVRRRCLPVLCWGAVAAVPSLPEGGSDAGCSGSECPEMQATVCRRCVSGPCEAVAPI
jgi:hypothetical protein